MVELSSKAAFALVLATGIVLPGVLNYYVSAILGHQTLGSLVWVIGYVGMVLVVWYYWIRPLDLTGPERDLDEAERKVKD